MVSRDAAVCPAAVAAPPRTILSSEMTTEDPPEAAPAPLGVEAAGPSAPLLPVVSLLLHAIDVTATSAATNDANPVLIIQ